MGASRSGKTFLLCYYLILRALKYKESNHLVFRSTLASLRMGVIGQTMPKVLRALEKSNELRCSIFELEVDGKPFVTYREPDKRPEYTFFNGSKIVGYGAAGSSTNEHALDRVLSTEWGTIFVSEANENQYDVIEKLMSRNTEVAFDCNGEQMIAKMVYDLNPHKKTDWDYIFFYLGKNPVSKENIKHDETAYIHFRTEDNAKFQDASYKDKLSQMSPANRMRFMHGEYSDDNGGEIFKKLYYEEVADWSQFERIVTYCDPSYKSGKNNDYKAVVTVGKIASSVVILNCLAVQGTTYEMIQLIHRSQTYYIDKLKSSAKLPRYDIWIENAGLADDFKSAHEKYCIDNKCIIPYKMDTVKKNNKFDRIESLLVPLNEQGLLRIDKNLMNSPYHEQLEVQFLNFSKNPKKDIHDDIPDAVHGAVSKLMKSGVNFIAKEVPIINRTLGRGR